MNLFYLMQGAEIALLVILMVAVTKMHLEEKRRIREEIERIEVEENTENLIYLDEYREEM